ncbi:MAG: hypothetical protein R3D98_04115 [Candidatus Krumholzibacteriia bacterium]
MRIDATVLMLTGLAAAYLLGVFFLPPALILAVATLSVAVPVGLREAGWLRDHDELLRRGQRRGGLWAFVLLLAMAPLYVLSESARDAFAGRSLEAALALFALVCLRESRGPRTAVRVLLNVAALLAAAYGLSHVPDLDKLAAMLAVAAGLAATAYLAGRVPALAATILAAATVAQLVQAARASAAALVTAVPTTIVWTAMAVLLYGAVRIEADED